VVVVERTPTNMISKTLSESAIRINVSLVLPLEKGYVGQCDDPCTVSEDQLSSHLLPGNTERFIHPKSFIPSSESTPLVEAAHETYERHRQLSCHEVQ
jgi:hypothetical protein